MSLKNVDDLRPRRKYGQNIKYAIDRDGDLFVVECPSCHSQESLEEEDKRCRGIFRCQKSTCNTLFEVYTEDGVRVIHDYREGDLEKWAVLTYDNDRLCAGISEDAPWWWPRKVVTARDLNRETGKDAHGHHPYYKLSRIIPEVPNGCSGMMRDG